MECKLMKIIKDETEIIGKTNGNSNNKLKYPKPTLRQMKMMKNMDI